MVNWHGSQSGQGSAGFFLTAVVNEPSGSEWHENHSHQQYKSWCKLEGQRHEPGGLGLTLSSPADVIGTIVLDGSVKHSSMESTLTIQKLTMIPNSMANCCTPIRRPRSSGGEHSATYMGTIIDSEPTPIPNATVRTSLPLSTIFHLPTMKRPPRIAECPADVAVHWTMTPRIKTQVLTMMAYFLEINSARKPEYSVPVHAPSSRMDVSHPFLVELVV